MILPRHPIEIGNPAEITLLLVGCGGTGSFAALHLARLAYEARRGGGARLRLVFVDPDRVEAKNIGRQNFCPAEIGQPKAVTLASRYNLAFGLDIGAVVGEFGIEMVTNWAARGHNWAADSMLLVIGCVDSPAARATIARAVDQASHKHTLRRIWWLDSGNSEHAGQVLIGNSMMAEPVIDPLLRCCVSLPWPSLQEPGIVQGSRGAGEQGAELSCAELMALNAQSLMVNQVMAGWIGVYVYRLLAHDLDVYQTWVDLRGGNVRSVAITEGQVAEVKPAVPETWREAAEALEDFAEIERLADAPGICPRCGGELAEGRDTTPEYMGDAELDEVDIVFCPNCQWQMTLDDYEVLRDDGETVLEGWDGDNLTGDGAAGADPGRRVAAAAEVVG